MAKPLELNLEHLASLHSVGSGHASPPQPDPAAMRAAVDLLNRLHRHGVLDFLRGLTGSSGDIANRLAEAADSSSGLRAMENGLALMNILGELDPEILKGLSRSWAAAPVKAVDARPQGLWTLLRRLSGPDSRRALGALIDGLEALGKSLNRGSR